MSNLGTRLKRARVAKKHTQQMVASKLGVSNGTISGYERSYRDPDSEILIKLADLYEVSLDWLYGREVTVVHKSGSIFADIISEAEETYEVRLNDDPIVLSAVRDLVRNLAILKSASLPKNEEFIQTNQNPTVDDVNLHNNSC